MIAYKSLRRLFEQAERAWARSGEPKASLVFSRASNPEYIGLSSFAEKQAYHAVLLHAEHRGAIAIEWDRNAGFQNQVARVRLRDGNALSEVLNAVPRWRSVEEATQLCTPLAGSFPIIGAVLGAWREGRKPRGLQACDARLLVDAAKAIDYCRQNSQQDMTVRRLSTRLGFDSKRLESLVPALDLLRASGLDEIPRDSEELFSELGIVKHPLPILLSGPATLGLRDDTTLATPAPYAGLAPNSIASVRVSDACKYVLSVENLTTFHELAEMQTPDVLLIYSNGMPSPSWCRFYGRMLGDLPSICRVLHWGDIDGGGYRIAAHIASVCRACKRTLMLHMMNPAVLPEQRSWRPLDTQEQTHMKRIAQELGWEIELRGISERPLAYEQEALDLVLP